MGGTGRRTCSIEGCLRPAYGHGWCNAHWQRWRHHGDPLAGGLTKGAAQAFVSAVLAAPPMDACIPWPYGGNRVGYGRINVAGRVRTAPQFVLESRVGPRPSPRHLTRHSCGNKLCVNPKHLRWATQKENMADCVAHGTHNRGERCGAAKLRIADVRFIRTQRGRVRQVDLARRFGVSRAAIGSIHQGRNWRHVP